MKETKKKHSTKTEIILEITYVALMLTMIIRTSAIGK